jgi:uncharacterized protein
MAAGMAFFLVFSSILAVVHVHIAFRMFVDTRPPSPFRQVALATMTVLWLLIPVSMVLNTSAPLALSFSTNLWMGCLFYLWTMFVVHDLAVYPWRLGRWLLQWVRRSRGVATADTVASAERRVFLARAVTGVAAVTTAGLGVSGVRSAMGEITQPEVVVRLSRLPKVLDGFRIAQLSDVHVGALLGDGFLRGVVDQTNQLKPDLVVITGDLVDGSVRELGPIVARLSELRARHGVCFVTGNHEYYSGADAWLAFLRKQGLHVLQNQRLRIGDSSGGASFDLVGIPDAGAARMHEVGADIHAAVRGRDTDRELIVLAHQPVQFPDARSVGAGLQLSGHTHGGQIQPFGQLVALAQPYVAGLHREGDSQIYVSRGTGFWGPPMRIGAPAEITDIRLING